jgi:DNA-binding MarR family transcriptional regulator
MDSNRKLVGEVLRAGRRLAIARDALFAHYGLTGAKVRLLKTVRRLPVPFTMAVLARAMNVTRQTVRTTAHELEAAGLLCLTENYRNCRAPLVTLTTLGRETLEEMLRVEQRWISDITRGFHSDLLAQTEWVIRIVRERVT